MSSRSLALVSVVVSAWSVAGCHPGPADTCAYRVSLPGATARATGGNVQERIDAPAGCPWPYRGDVPWITVATAPPAPAGNGDGTVLIQVAPNSGPRRVGTATIAYQTVTVDQAGTDGAGPCTVSLFPMTSSPFGAGGGTGAFAVVPSAPDCGWYVEARDPDDDWIDNDFTAGMGNKVATYTVRSGSAVPFVPLPRTGRMALYNSAGQRVLEHTVTQVP